MKLNQLIEIILKITDVGLFLVPLMLFLTALSFYFNDYMPSVSFKGLVHISAILSFASLILWFVAGFKSHIVNYVLKDQLLTSGLYAIVRNPIYVAIALFFTFSLVCLTNNLCQIWILFLFWLLITILVKYVEEPKLKKKFKESYINYCQRVNRCIPWFPKRK